ncbi:MAG: DUF86 domain-containing protein [Sulfurimonas sp.]|uniref:HepT-like ribonuclease domain-containing protein n=1 Tax=Sulfurimonas sp. TaxID=2022749 RepID=UPI002611D96B|nr:HepT-like ribonuclease domain-containing protein [Sulfurimonas sp.]MDD2651822.1 DUF86 domain-containing protein [Sulfurimonas sp.]MDD3451626.1 DUF86 domain-containing protein [Sulfurimonas sp.]
MSRVKELFLFDMLIAIAKIEETCKNFSDGDALKHNYMAWDSVIREFEIIGEATKNLINSEVFDTSKREIVNFRNVLIHEYFGIDEEEVFDIARNKLNDLKQIAISKIETIEKELKEELIIDFIDENRHLNFVVDAVTKLRK